MAEWVRGFVISDVAEVHAKFAKCISDAELLVAEERRTGVDVGAKALLDDLNLAYRQFQSGLQQTAQRGSRAAMEGMIERLKSNRIRPPSGNTPPLEDLITAAPISVGSGRFETGAVGVANVENLNRATNPHSRGYGPYWRAVEYGTGQDGVPSQIGRILYGAFTDAGGSDATPPLNEYAGGGGPHPVFVSAANNESSVNGLGTIGHEVQGKHFIKLGADAAAVKWRADVAEVQARALDQLSGIKLKGS